MAAPLSPNYIRANLPNLVKTGQVSLIESIKYLVPDPELAASGPQNLLERVAAGYEGTKKNIQTAVDNAGQSVKNTMDIMQWLPVMMVAIIFVGVVSAFRK